MPSRTVRVNLGERSYDVHVGGGILPELGARLLEVIRPRAVLLVADDALPAALLGTATQSLQAAGLTVTSLSLHASERDKSLAAAQQIVEAAAAARLERADAIVAVGGGVIGDLAGFAASIYRRGIAVIHCPTTLLSMVDASVGGKTAVNLVVGAPNGHPSHSPDRLLKNMVGTFHQPRLVIADVHTLGSLPHRHLRAGLAECIKHALLGMDFGDGAMLPMLEKDGPAYAAGTASDESFIALVARNVAIKAEVVSTDEFEQAPAASSAGAGAPNNAGRESLNLGHTFGHALEAMPHLSPDGDPASAPLHHGEAVALGLIAATATAEALNQIPPGSTEKVRAVIASVGLPTRTAGLPDDDAIIGAMMDDKKVHGGRLRLVLPWREMGRVRMTEGAPRDVVATGIAAIRA